MTVHAILWTYCGIIVLFCGANLLPTVCHFCRSQYNMIDALASCSARVGSREELTAAHSNHSPIYLCDTL